MIKIYLKPIDSQYGPQITLPINPEKIQVQSGAKFQTFSSSELGEFQFPRGVVPFHISFDSIFPGPGRLNMTRGGLRTGPNEPAIPDPNFVSVVDEENQPPWIDLTEYGHLNATTGVDTGDQNHSHVLTHQLETWARAGTLLNFRVTTTGQLDFLNAQMVIENPFQYTIQGGHGDIFYHLSLIEQRKLVIYAIKDVRGLIGTGGPANDKQGKTGPGTYVPPTVVDPASVLLGASTSPGYTEGFVSFAVDEHAVDMGSGFNGGFVGFLVDEHAVDKGSGIDPSQPNRNPAGTLPVVVTASQLNNTGSQVVSGSTVPAPPAAPSGEQVSRPGDLPAITEWVIQGDESGQNLWGDTLPSIALACYGDENQWPIIYQANIALLTEMQTTYGVPPADVNFPDTETIFPGYKLNIPNPSNPQWYIDYQHRQQADVGEQRSAAAIR